MSAAAVERRQLVPVSEGQIKLITWAIGLMAAATIGAVPWAIQMERGVASLQAEMKATREKVDSIQTPPDWFRLQVERNTNDIDEIEKRVGKLEAAK